jgi:hypothetical protein
VAGSSKRHLEAPEPDVLDISGGGQFPCAACDRHFVDDTALKGHLKSKIREYSGFAVELGSLCADKRRLKQLSEGGFDPADADKAIVSIPISL